MCDFMHVSSSISKSNKIQTTKEKFKALGVASFIMFSK